MVVDVSALEGNGGSLRATAVRAAAVALHGPRLRGRLGEVTRFGWHFGQMAAAMMVGMAPLGVALSVLGRPDLDIQSPEAYALAMTVSMVLPMAAWMRVMGHRWERTAEMAAAMTVPVVVLAAGSLLGPLPHSSAVTGMNVFMWVGMLGAMVVRWREYAGQCHGDAASHEVHA